MSTSHLQEIRCSDSDDMATKKEIGQRFKRFREAVGKSKKQLALELKISLKRVYDIEKGEIYPGTGLVLCIMNQYGLNPSWLLFGNENYEMFLLKKLVDVLLKPGVESFIERGKGRRDIYDNLLFLMPLPFISQIIFGKLEELKRFAKKEIEEFQKRSQLTKNN
jgi:transcriptional regulator with XRE-family HTH domain